MNSYIKAKIPNSTNVGPFSIIEEGAVIGELCEISSHVRIMNRTTIGKLCKIFHGAVLGETPQDLKFTGEESFLQIGDATTIREYATIHRGTRGKATVIGSNVLIMNYAHVAHDCKIGNHVILSNSVQLAGHVEIGDHAILGGIVPVHQFVKIGEHAFIGGGYRVSQDVPPYVLAAGEPLRFCGLNYVGLKRRNFSPETIAQLEKAYQILYRSQLMRSAAISRIKDEFSIENEIQVIVEFFEKSERGIIR